VANEIERLKLALAQRYRLDREVGRGGMATVYRAHDLRHDRSVAIKVLKPELAAALGAERFLREITLTARLDHPHILPLLDSGEAEGFLYYVMPYVEGESLRDRLNRERQLPLDDALQIVREVADALSHAHRLGIVHRDIKPENILLSAGHARVADFGIARAVEAAGGETVTRLTATGIAAGTPLYMSPEQANGERDVDARTDVYSLACVLYETLAGQPPYTGATAAAILALKSLEAVPRLRVVRDAVPTGVEEAITKGLARIPADRFGTPSQFAEALERGRAVMTPVAPVSHRVPRRRLLLPTAATLVLVIAGAWWVTQREPQSTAITSLAVLPLKNLMGDPAQDYFVEGMQEALTAELSKLGAVKVISRTSAMRYRDTDKTMRQIARELGVEGLIEGSVLREGEQVRISVRLIHGPSDRHIWADSYQRRLRDALMLQSEVARAIATQIEVTLTPEQESLAARARPVDPEAYTLYLKGNFQAIRRMYPDAIEHYQQAIAIDSSFAPAHAGLAIASIEAVLFGTDLPTDFHSMATRSKAAALKALELDSRQAEAHIALGRVNQLLEWDWVGADAAFRRGIDLNPSSNAALLAYHNYLITMGRSDDAVAVSRMMIERDPLAAYPHNSLAFTLLHRGHYAEALEHNKRALELEPDHIDFTLLRGELYVLMERFDEALAYAERADALGAGRVGSVGIGSAFRFRLGHIYAKANGRDSAMRILNQMTTRAQADYTSPVSLAIMHLALDHKREALALLEQGYEQRDPLVVFLKIYYMFDPLRGDPRFQELLERMDFPR
jgi:eukaryotic-like serine/threonine-protein kinase